MAHPVRLDIHPSLFPATEQEAVQRELRAGRVHQRLHYQGDAQAARWLALYERWSPFANRPGFARMFETAFAESLDQTPESLTVVGLGCGGAHKEQRLIEQLTSVRKDVGFAAVDASVPLLVEAALRIGGQPGFEGLPLLAADLLAADDLNKWLDRVLPPDRSRLFTLFSVVPNFSSTSIIAAVSSWLRPGDQLLLSVNLAPDGGGEGLETVLPQYDNAETRAWLQTFLGQAGVAEVDGELRFSVERESKASEVRRIVARWHFSRATRVQARLREFAFAAGDVLEVFFTNRHRLEDFTRRLQAAALEVEAVWKTDDGEEALLRCRAGGVTRRPLS